MDETIAKWIIEFLLHQRIDDKIINGIISSLPLSINDYRLKKTMLLRRIETETSNGCVSEKLLELIEIIEALDHEQGKTASNLMKEAYCLVAVDCTVRFLGESGEENVKYIEMVEIVWKNRVCKSEGLVSEMSQRWLDDIEAAAKDSGVCEKIWLRNTRNEALKAVKAYLKEAWEYLGPPFLEMVATKVGNEVEELRGGGGGGVVHSSNHFRDLVAFEGTQKGQTVSRRKHAAVKSRRQRGAKLSDADEDAMNKVGDSTTETVRAEDLTPEMDRGNEAISSSFTKLPAVGDHLSDNVQTAETLSSKGPTGINSAVEADQKRPEILESREAVRMQRELRNSTRELHAVMSDPLSKGPTRINSAVEAGQKTREILNVQTAETLSSKGPTGINSAVEAGLKRPEILESSEAVGMQRELRNSTRELHAVVSDPLSKGPTVINTAVEAGQKRPEILESHQAVRMQRELQNSTRELHAAASDPLPKGPTGKNSAVEAGQKRPQILESRDAVRMQRELRSSTRELHAAVSDPLPEALQTAQTLISSMETNNLETAPRNQTEQDMPMIPEAERVQTAQEAAEKTITNTKNDAGASKQAGTEMDAPKEPNENDSGNVKESALNEDARGNVIRDPGTQNNVRKRSLMEPNETSHTYQWNDEIENSSGSPARPRLPSPKVQRTSPLKVPEYRYVQRRRERKRWTSLEEDTLREGVLKYGRGNWKLILYDVKFAEVFQGRTEVDLKDKWRNLTKYS